MTKETLLAEGILQAIAAAGRVAASLAAVFHSRDQVSTFFFSVSVPAGDEQLPDLLRQLADHLAGLGSVSVRDVTVNPAQQLGGYSVATVYYNRLDA